jgi:prolyl oligopeptidase
LNVLGVRAAWPALVALSVVLLLAACAGGGGPSSGNEGGEPRTPVGPGARGYPFAASRTLSQDWFGEAVGDDFQWLEKPADPYTRSWTAAEAAYGRRHLDAMPARAALRERLQALIGSTANIYAAPVERGGLVFALKIAPALQWPVVVALKSIDDAGSERVVFDPNEDNAGGAGAIEFFRPSPDGRRLAVGVRDAGGGGSSLRVVDVATATAQGDRIAAVADAAWSASGHLFYTRPAGSGDAAGAEQVFLRKAGAPVAPDRLELGAAFGRAARTRLASSRDGRTLAALVAAGPAGDTALYVKTAEASGDGAWRRVAGEADGVRQVQFGDDDALYAWTVANAPRGRVVRVPLADTRASGLDKAPTIVAPADAVLQHMAVAGSTLVVAELAGSTPRLRTIDLKTRRASTQALPAGTAVSALARSGRGEVVAQLSTLLAPPWWTHVGGRARRTALLATTDAGFNDCEVAHEFAPSQDGTAVPMTLLRRRGMRADGRNPVLLAPGGTDAALAFDPARRAWLDRGGVVAIAHVRGSEGLGETWRRDGLGARSGNAVEDLVAAARTLAQRGVTQPALLGVTGRGAQATLVAAAVVQHPELFRAASVAAGAYDLLLAARDPAGAPEAATAAGIADRAQFQILRGVSPQQGVRDGAAYPAVLVTLGDATSANASHARKWVARLQQADPSGRAILMRTGGAGAAGLSERVEQASDEFGFFLHELLAAQ